MTLTKAERPVLSFLAILARGTRTMYPLPSGDTMSANTGGVQMRGDAIWVAIRFGLWAFAAFACIGLVWLAFFASIVPL
jgi:hypothetical protein